MQERLVKIRRENKLRQSDLAKLIGVTAESYRMKENGKSQFKSKEMFTIARYFKKSISDIFTE